MAYRRVQVRKSRQASPRSIRHKRMTKLRIGSTVHTAFGGSAASPVGFATGWRDCGNNRLRAALRITGTQAFAGFATVKGLVGCANNQSAQPRVALLPFLFRLGFRL